MLTVAFTGTVAFQIPIGWLADRTSRQRLLRLLIALFIAIPDLIPAVLSSEPLLWLMLLIWGGASMGVYTVGLSLVGDKFAASELPGANAAFVMVYEFGSMVGPVWCGAGMDLLGPSGFLWALAVPAVFFFLLPARRG